MLRPPEQVLFHAAACPEAETKQPAGTPEYRDTAVMRSGYVAARTLDIIAVARQTLEITQNGQLTSGRPTRHKHFFRINLVLRNCVLDHVGNGIRGASAIVSSSTKSAESFK